MQGEKGYKKCKYVAVFKNSSKFKLMKLSVNKAKVAERIRAYSDSTSPDPGHELLVTPRSMTTSC